MNNSISEKDMFMLMMENAEKRQKKKPTCKEAFEHRKDTNVFKKAVEYVKQNSSVNEIILYLD